MVQEILEHHRCVQNEPSSRLQRLPHGTQESCVPFVVKIAEAVAGAECAIESFRPWQVAHVSRFPGDVVQRVARVAHDRGTPTTSRRRSHDSRARPAATRGGRPRTDVEDLCAAWHGEKAARAGRPRAACARLGAREATSSPPRPRKSFPTSSFVHSR
jgi:hypothetical protein